jgi:dephospho-CoA kinase
MRDLLVERWGQRAAPDGAVDRSAVAEIVFEDSDEREWLESLLHPRVAQRMVDWRSAIDPGTAVAVMEVPLLYETGMDEAFDEIIVVVAGDELREARVAERGDTAAAGREQAQLGQAEKAKRADHLVVNDGSLDDLERELAAVLERIKAAGGASA